MALFRGHNAIELPKELLSSFLIKLCLGLLVHNDEVTKELDVLGITTIDLTSIDPIERLKLFKNDEIEFYGIRSSGKYEHILKENNVTFIDATCAVSKRCFF